jgi:DeoR family transcriptional regulator, suf operon transcriptional repressor
MLDETDNKKTRERVLKALLTQERCTVNELAEAVKINPISVRHHINRLEIEGLVASAEERHGVGRPRMVYFLTESGRERFPTRYIQLTLRLLEQLKGTMPRAMVNRMFAQMAEEMAAGYQSDLEHLTIEERLDVVTELLSGEGFSVEWERQGEYFQIHEKNCPYFHVGQNHPEVCSVDQTLISTILNVPAQKIQCLLQGDNHCTYIVPHLPVLEEQ